MDIQTQVYSGMWIRLPHEVKNRIAELFSIVRTNATHVMDGIVLADGYSEEELAKLNVSSLQAYLQSEETDIFKLFNQLVAKVGGELSQESVKPEEVEKPHTEVNIKIDGDEVKVESKKVTKTKKNA